MTITGIRAGFKKALEDPGLEIAYRANIAMLLHDRYGMNHAYPVDAQRT